MTGTSIDGRVLIALSPIRLLVASNVWVAAAVASLAAFTERHLALHVPWQALLVVFAATLAIYNTDRFFDAPAADPSRNLGRHPHALLAATGVFGVAAGLVGAPVSAVALVVVGGAACMVYGAPLPRALRRLGAPARIKEVAGAKSWFVAAAVSVATVAVPVAFATDPLAIARAHQLDIAALGGLYLAMTVIDAHLFDIRDVEHDRRDGVRTLPVLLGLARTRAVLLAVIAGWLAAAAIAVTSFGMTLGPAPVAGLLVLAVASLTLTPRTPPLVFDLLVDGALFAPWLVSWVV